MDLYVVFPARLCVHGNLRGFNLLVVLKSTSALLRRQELHATSAVKDHAMSLKQLTGMAVLRPGFAIMAANSVLKRKYPKAFLQIGKNKAFSLVQKAQCLS